MSGVNAPLRTPTMPPPNAHDAPAWAHASGWAQLSGARQTVSCVLSCENSARTLSKLLPILSDTLTECGYPWELIVVDAGSTDGTDGLMRAWCDLPGFRFLPLGRPASLAAGFEAGILAARGDAVVLLDPALRHSPELIPQMILQWESNARLVWAQAIGNRAAAPCGIGTRRRCTSSCPGPISCCRRSAWNSACSTAASSTACFRPADASRPAAPRGPARSRSAPG